MITNLIELYGELEYLNNEAKQVQYEISSIKRFTPRAQEYVAGLLNSLINNWESSGLQAINLGFNDELERNMRYINSEFKWLLSDYYKLIESESNINLKQLIESIQLHITDIVESIYDIQRIINDFDSDFIFSNVVIKEQFDKLAKSYEQLIKMITPVYKDETEIIQLPDIYREDITEFMNYLIRFVKHFGINIELQTARLLYEPLFSKQTVADYKRRLEEFEHFVDSMLVQIREKINNVM